MLWRREPEPGCGVFSCCQVRPMLRVSRCGQYRWLQSSLRVSPAWAGAAWGGSACEGAVRREPAQDRRGQGRPSSSHHPADRRRTAAYSAASAGRDHTRVLATSQPRRRRAGPGHDGRPARCRAELSHARLTRAEEKVPS